MIGIGLHCLLLTVLIISGCAAPSPVYHGENARWIDRGPSLFSRYTFEITGISVGDSVRHFDIEKFPDGNYFIGIRPVEERCEQQRKRLFVYLSVSRLLEDSEDALIFRASGLLSDMPKTMDVVTGFLDYYFSPDSSQTNYEGSRKAGSNNLYHKGRYRFTLDIQTVDGGEDLDDCLFALTIGHVVSVDPEKKSSKPSPGSTTPQAR